MNATRSFEIGRDSERTLGESTPPFSQKFLVPTPLLHSLDSPRSSTRHHPFFCVAPSRTAFSLTLVSNRISVLSSVSRRNPLAEFPPSEYPSSVSTSVQWGTVVSIACETRFPSLGNASSPSSKTEKECMAKPLVAESTTRVNHCVDFS